MKRAPAQAVLRHVAPGRSQSAASPTGRAACSPSQVRCMHIGLKTTQTIRSLSGPKRNQPHICGADFFLGSGNVLLSRAVSSQVPSALKGLTSVFGMGTGGTLSPLSPEFCQGLVQTASFLASASSVYNRSFHLGELPHNLRSSSIRAYPENRTSRFPSPCEKPISYFNFPFGLT